MDQTQREFLLEIEELVEKTFADLDELRATQADDRTTFKARTARELIDRIFRRVHSIKGSAASCGLEVVSQIAHEFENLLAAVRSGRVVIDEAVVDTCESATEAVAESLSLAASGIVEPSRRVLFERLQAAARNNTGNDTAPSGDTEAVLKNLPFEIWQSLTDPEKQRLVNIVAEKTPLFVVSTNFDIGNFDEQFFLLKEKLMELGEIISTSPAVVDEHPDRVNFRILYACEASLSDVQAAVVDFPEVVFKAITNASSEPRSAAAAPSARNSSPPSLSALSNFVRTDLNKLDRLISATHELLRTTSNALNLALSKQPLTTPAREQLQKLDQQIRNSFMSVEDELISLRTVSLGPALQRALRAGRAAARLAGKEINFEISGAEVLVDKLLLDVVADPLVHLVRNAVDHGIENSEERVRAGKKRRGTVRIEAISEGSQSRLRVVDDGRGIDPLLVSEAALRLGIVPDETALDIDHSLRLIFRPGFTTLAAASDVSGRGVGLDIVETAVEQVGGELRVSSTPNDGAMFEIRLPVTFGLLEATVFVSGGNRYCIPAIQTIAFDTIAKSRTEVATENHRDGVDEVPLISSRELLGQTPDAVLANSSGRGRGKAAGKHLRTQSNVITCEFQDEHAGASNNGSRRIGLIVDALEGTEKVLVRNLGRHAGRWYGVAGATELRDGTVALVLDLPRLLSG